MDIHALGTAEKQPRLTENKLNTLSSAIINMFFPEDITPTNTDLPTPTDETSEKSRVQIDVQTPTTQKSNAWIYWTVGGVLAVATAGGIWYFKTQNSKKA